MSGFRLQAALGLAAVALGVSAGLYVANLRSTLEATREAKDKAEKLVTERDQAIAGLRESAGKTALALAKLEGERTAVRSILSERDILIRNLTNENAEIRSWSAVAVPGDIARLHNHPAVTGAAAYREQMRPRDPVQPARREPAPQR